MILQSASFLSTTTDDDEISAFVQAIDARAPLSVKRTGGRNTSEHTETGERERREGQEHREQGRLWAEDTERMGNNVVPGPGGEKDVPRIGLAAKARQVDGVDETMGTMGVAEERNEEGVVWDSGEAAMASDDREATISQSRTYRDHVESELKRMNDAFLLSLAGLEGRPRRRTGAGRTTVPGE